MHTLTDSWQRLRAIMSTDGYMYAELRIITMYADGEFVHILEQSNEYIGSVRCLEGESMNGAIQRLIDNVIAERNQRGNNENA